MLNKNSPKVIFLDNKYDFLINQKENIDLIYPCTKFLIPGVQPNIIKRESLLRKLDISVSKKLTIVHSPAGFGKTTIISKWVHDRKYNNRVLWITLDNRDEDIYNFWHCITFGLFNQMKNEFEECLNLFNAYSLYPIEAIINLLVNSLDKINKEIFIILDDFHNIYNSELIDSLRLFLSRMPMNTHILVLSRNKPYIALSKLKILDELHEISLEDLKFSNVETEDLLNNKLNLGLNDLELKDLHNRTEGWIAAIKLAATSFESNPKRMGIIEHLNSSYQCLSEFLFDEIIYNYPIEIQEFIIKTSVLETLNTSLCNYIMNIKNSNEILESLMHNQLFIFSLDTNHENYRYHGLFADILRNKLKLKHPALLEELYLRASNWSEKNGQILEAISYSIRSGNEENSKKLIEDYSEKIICRSDYFKFIEYINALPNSILNNPIVNFSIENFKESSIINAEEALTLREKEVLRCLSSGATNQEIAAKLFLSSNTVKKHINNIFNKLKVKNRVQAVGVFKKLESK